MLSDFAIAGYSTRAEGSEKHSFKISLDIDINGKSFKDGAEVKIRDARSSLERAFWCAYAK